MMTKQNWGTLDGDVPIQLYTLRNGRGVEARITNYGGRLVSLQTPDRKGQSADVVLGFDSLAGYLGKNPYFGALVGRFANRIGNGEFSLAGKTYQLARNNGPNALHGGLKGFDKVAWSAKEAEFEGAPALELQYVSADGEEGFPGQLQTTVRYALNESNELRLDYEAVSDKPTVLNLTNHSYFDLSGSGTGEIVDLEVLISASYFTPVNEHLIPTGEIRSVAGTPFDFRQTKVIGSRISESDEQLKRGWGYDHNYVIDGDEGHLRLAARAHDPHSGRILEVRTTQPGMQFYTGNHLDGSVAGKGGKVSGFRSGVCFETQHFPDSPNRPEFPSTVLTPGERFRSTTVFRFSVE